jgi:hypothetical protein
MFAIWYLPQFGNLFIQSAAKCTCTNFILQKSETILEQKSYLPMKLQFMSGFGKTTIFNGLLGNRPDVFCWASDYLIWSSFWSPE